MSNRYTKYQLDELAKCAESGVDISKLSDPHMPHTTMHEIRKGLKNGVDITPLPLGHLTFFQIRELRFALQNRVNPELLLSDKFSSFQMRELRLGAEAHIDISKYAYTSIDHHRMCAARHKLINEQLESRDVYYCIDCGEDKRYRIYTLEKTNISLLTPSKFTCINDAKEHLKKAMRVDNFYQHSTHVLWGIDALQAIAGQLTVASLLNVKYPNLLQNSGYTLLAENKGYALGFSPTAPDSFVIWHKDCDGDYYGGKYYASFTNSVLLDGVDVEIDMIAAERILSDIGVTRSANQDEEMEM